MFTKRQIETILCREITSARERYQRADNALKLITSDIAAPDGLLRIQKAEQERRAAFEGLRNAVGQWNAYNADGKNLFTHV